MSDITASTSVSTADVPSATESAKNVPPPRAKGRKGKQASQRAAEKFRFKKNEVFDKSRQDELAKRFGSSTSVTSMFGEILLSRTFPPIRFTISTEAVIPICRHMVDSLKHAYKVVMKDSDFSILVIVTILQIEAKVWISQQASQFIARVDLAVEERIERTKATLSEALFPISYYIEQIGSVTVDGQRLVPHVVDLTYDALMERADQIGVRAVPPGTIVLPANNALVGAAMWVNIINLPLGTQRGILVEDAESGIIGLSADFLRSPHEFEYIEVLRLSPPQDVFPSFDEVIGSYTDLIGRINRRITN